MEQFLIPHKVDGKINCYLLAKRFDIGCYNIKPIPTIYYWQLMWKLKNSKPCQ